MPRRHGRDPVASALAELLAHRTASLRTPDLHGAVASLVARRLVRGSPRHPTPDLTAAVASRVAALMVVRSASRRTPDLADAVASLVARRLVVSGASRRTPDLVAAVASMVAARLGSGASLRMPHLSGARSSSEAAPRMVRRGRRPARGREGRASNDFVLMVASAVADQLRGAEVASLAQRSAAVPALRHLLGDLRRSSDDDGVVARRVASAIMPGLAPSGAPAEKVDALNRAIADLLGSSRGGELPVADESFEDPNSRGDEDES